MHPNDEILLAYLDGEMSRPQARAIRNHLKICWKCRSILSDLESQAETISRMLSTQLDSDIDRSIKAKERFLQWRDSFEKTQKSLFRSHCSLLLDSLACVALAQSETDSPVSLLA
ncbi:MAG: zf-HC2 domain-containing protein [Nitrososphaerota archaeon]|nr:zf-HC2 domain-containing protein [Nitrososphaerota archaeon]